MKRIDFFIPQDSFDYLKSRPGTISEHIRFAIAEYINRLRQEENRLSSSSESVLLRGGGEKDG